MRALKTWAAMICAVAVIAGVSGCSGSGSGTATPTLDLSGLSDDEKFCVLATETFKDYQDMDASEALDPEHFHEFAADFATVAEVAPAEYKADWERYADLLERMAIAMEDPDNVSAEESKELATITDLQPLLVESSRICQTSAPTATTKE